MTKATYEQGCWADGARGERAADAVLLKVARSYGFTGEYPPEPDNTHSRYNIAFIAWADDYAEITRAVRTFIQTNVLTDGDIGDWHHGDFMVMPPTWWIMCETEEE